MLSERAAADIDRQIEEQVRNLRYTYSDSRRETIMERIKQLKALKDDIDPEEANEEIVISLDEVIDTVRDLFRRKRNN